ncbi:MAG: exosortase/archaeosortase family protein [Planctomycetota bacterium]|nr:exosortase/archaeosortase family protein [Planctomycetota bacterium]
MRKRRLLKKEGARRLRLESHGFGNPASSSRLEEPTEAIAELNYTVPKKQLAYAIGFVVVVFLLCYWKTLVSMEIQWRTEPDYSHGYLIIPLSVVLLYSRRDSFPGYRAKICWTGLILVCIAGALRIISSLSYMDFLDGWSIVPWVAGIVWMLVGGKALRWALPAILFLFLLSPLPYRVETFLSWKLQSVVTLLSAEVLRIMGLPAIAEGNTIWIGNVQMLIEEACSGLRIFVSMGAFAFFWASIIQRAWIDRIVVLAAALPMAIVANTIRVVATCCSFYYFDQQTATTLHDWEGVLMVFLAAGLLWCVMFYWQKLYYPEDIVLPRSKLRPV